MISAIRPRAFMLAAFCISILCSCVRDPPPETLVPSLPEVGEASPTSTRM